MKFNFEGFKKNQIEKIKPYVLPTLAILSLSLLKNHSSGKEQIKLTNENPKEIGVDSSQQEKREKVYIPLEFKEVKVEKAIPKIEENDEKKLTEEINRLQEEITKVSDLEPVIKEGVFSIVSRDDLAQKESNSKYLARGTYQTSPLDMRRIAMNVEHEILNQVEDVKLTSTELYALKEEKKLQDEGYVSTFTPSKYYIPEFYLVLENKRENNIFGTFIKIFSSKDNKIVKTINLIKNLPKGDEFTNPEFHSLVDNEIVPEIVEALKKEISDKVNINNNLEK